MHDPATDTWTVTLDRYQRDNLLWLLTAVWGVQGDFGPFSCANTGDWVGEIPYKLRLAGQEHPRVEPHDRPNIGHADLQRRIDGWLQEWRKRHGD